MSYKFDENAKYTKTHEWVRIEGDVAVMGVSDYAQDSLSDVVYVDFPGEGEHFNKGDVIATVESVKAAEDVYAPISGEVVELNEALNDNPEWVNEDPYGKGWFLKLKPDDLSELDDLMDAAAYEAFVAEEAEKGGH
jgi:glycine cleavage system H protein